MNLEIFLARITALAGNASPDELRLILTIAERVDRARSQYGAMNMATDQRDFRKEKREELFDAMVYDVLTDMSEAEREFRDRETLTPPPGEMPK